MPIPPNICRDDIIQAMLKIDKNGVPRKRRIRKYFVLYEQKSYPCKLLISWANIYANGEELDFNPRNFQTQSAKKLLEELEFTVLTFTK